MTDPFRAGGRDDDSDQSNLEQHQIPLDHYHQGKTHQGNDAQQLSEPGEDLLGEQESPPDNGAMPSLPLTFGIIPSNRWPLGHASLAPLFGAHQRATSASSIHNAYQMQTLAIWLLLTNSL